MATSEDDKKLLKTMVTLAKKGPINTAICYGVKPEGAVILMDKRKDPSALSLKAKAAGETAKIAFGTMAVEGTFATFKCYESTKPPSGLKKQLTLFFKSIDIKLTFEIMDSTGAVVLDNEDGTGAPAGEGEATPAKVEETAQTETTAVLPEADVEAEAESETSGTETEADTDTDAGTTEPIDPKAIIARVKAAKLGAADIAGPIGEKLRARIEALVALVKEGAFSKVTGGLAKVEEALAKLGAASGGTTDSGGDQVAGGEQATKPDPEADPVYGKFSKGEKVLRGLVAALPGGDAADAMNALLDKVLEAIAQGEVEVAASSLKRVQDGLKLQKEVDRLAPLVAAAAASGMVADANALNLLFNWVAGKIPAADHAKAMGGLAKVETMLAAGAAQVKSTFAEEVPPETRPYATARLNWSFTRDKLRTEIGRLEASIMQVLADEGITDTSPIDGKLFAYIDKLDARLEQKLGEIVNSDAGDGREKLKGEARSLIAEYRNELNTDFFKDVDDNNGFTPVAITSSAREMLNDLSQVLAA